MNEQQTDPASTNVDTTDNPPPLTPEQARLVAAILFGGAK